MAKNYNLKYSGAEMDNLLTKIENAPEEIASENFVKTEVADLVNSAPETLDTLGEIANAIQENEEVVDALNAAIGNKADKTYVDNQIANVCGQFAIHEYSNSTSYEDVTEKVYTANVSLSDGLYLVTASSGGSSGNSAYATSSLGINGTYCESFNNETDYYISNLFAWLIVSENKATMYIEDKTTGVLKTLTVSAKPTSISIKGTSGYSSKYVNTIFIKYLNIYKV